MRRGRPWEAVEERAGRGCRRGRARPSRRAARVVAAVSVRLLSATGQPLSPRTGLWRLVVLIVRAARLVAAIASEEAGVHLAPHSRRDGLPVARRLRTPSRVGGSTAAGGEPLHVLDRSVSRVLLAIHVSSRALQLVRIAAGAALDAARRVDVDVDHGAALATRGSVEEHPVALCVPGTVRGVQEDRRRHTSWDGGRSEQFLVAAADERGALLALCR